MAGEDPVVADLRLKLRAAERRSDDAEREAERAREDADRALSRLRVVLKPFYQALGMVFGELDAAGVVDEAPTSQASSGAKDARLDAIWDSWKKRLGPTCAKIIEALLLQPDMTNRQIAVAIGTGRIQTIYESITKMNKVSLLTKSGDRYSLKKL